MRGLLGWSQGLLPQSQNQSRESQDVPRGVQVAVEGQPATWAVICSVGEGEGLSMSTAGAILRRIRGVHGDLPPTGPCCLVREEVRELAPRRVVNALGKTMVMHHPVDRQVFDGDQIKGVDQT